MSWPSPSFGPRATWQDPFFRTVQPRAEVDRFDSFRATGWPNTSSGSSGCSVGPWRLRSGPDWKKIREVWIRQLINFRHLMTCYLRYFNKSVKARVKVASSNPSTLYWIDFLHCKICNVCLKKSKINETQAGDCPFEKALYRFLIRRTLFIKIFFKNETFSVFILFLSFQ